MHRKQLWPDPGLLAAADEAALGVIGSDTPAGRTQEAWGASEKDRDRGVRPRGERSEGLAGGQPGGLGEGEPRSLPEADWGTGKASLR